MKRPILDVSDVAVSFGGVRALDGVSFSAQGGEILGLIGPNGAGKTTLFNCVCGLYRPSRGSIAMGGRPVAGLKPHEIAALGVGRTFQNVALFPSLSVLDNVLTGAHAHMRSGYLACALGLAETRREERRERERAERLLAEMGLLPHASARVQALPFGTRKRVELARALMGRPALLLLDEPAGGLDHAEVEAFGAALKELRDRHGLTILLVEHHMGLVMAASDRVVVLDFGRKIAEGTPREIGGDARVLDAYLGAAGP